MTRHRHRGPDYAAQLVLLKLLLDTDGEDALIERIGDCVNCWRSIVATLVADKWINMINRHGMPDMRESDGLITGRAIEVASLQLLYALDANGDGDFDELAQARRRRDER